MRPLLVLALTVAVTSAFADPLIDIPTARKLTYGTYKVEFADQFSNGLTQLGWLDVGIGKSFETTIRAERIDGNPIHPTADLMYSYISALPGVSPGLAFGVQDIANTTEDRRRFYTVLTYRDPTETFDGEVPADLTVGLYYYRNGIRPFGGLLFPLSHRVKLLVEHNGTRAAGGIELDLSTSLAVRLLYRGSSTMADFVWAAHF